MDRAENERLTRVGPGTRYKYELLSRDGVLPGVGDEIEEDGTRLRVSKIAPSHLPGDRRRCAYLQPVR